MACAPCVGKQTKQPTDNYETTHDEGQGEATALLGGVTVCRDSRDDNVQVTPRRFVVFGLFLLINIIAGYSINLVQSAESTAEAAYTGLSVNQLSTIQLAAQVPGMLLEPFLIKTVGMRYLAIAMAFFQLAGYMCIGGVPYFAVNTEATWLYAGNAFIGFTAGVMLIPIAKMVTTWMPDSERDAALALGLNAGNIGTGTGYFLVELIAGSNHVQISKVPSEHINAMHTYLNYLPILPALSLVLVIIFMQDEPEHPPSIAAYEQRQASKNDPDAGIIAGLIAPWRSWREDLCSIGADGFLISVVLFGALQIAIYTTATFIPDVMIPFGFSYRLVAIIGALFFYLNVIGATCLSTLAYKFLTPIKAAVSLSTVVIVILISIFFIILNNVNGSAYVALLLSLALIAAPAQAVACDFGCNTMFPHDENSIMFWQMVVGQSLAALFNVLFRMTKGWSDPVPYAYGYTLEVVLLLVGVIGCCFWKGSYKRDEEEIENLKASQEEKRMIDRLRESLQGKGMDAWVRQTESSKSQV